MTRFNLGMHDSGRGWYVADVVFMVVKLEDACEKLKLEHTNVIKAKDDAHREKEDQWETYESELREKTEEAIRVSNEWKGRGEKLADVEAQLGAARSEMERFEEERTQVGDLTDALDRERALSQRANATVAEL